MRTIRLGLPTGICKLVLWEDTPEENAFVIKAMNSRPYVEAAGKKYYLTKEEKDALEKISKVIKTA